MQNDLTDDQKTQLVSGGLCNLHEHDTTLNEHRHIEALQSLEVVKTVSSDYTLEYRIDILLVDTTNGNVTVTLPLSRNGRKFYVIKIAAPNTLKIQCSGADLILGSSSLSVTNLGSKQVLKSITGGYIPL